MIPDSLIRDIARLLGDVANHEERIKKLEEKIGDKSKEIN